MLRVLLYYVKIDAIMSTRLPTIPFSFILLTAALIADEENRERKR